MDGQVILRIFGDALRKFETVVAGSQRVRDDDHPDWQAALHLRERLRVPRSQHGGPVDPRGQHLRHHRQAGPPHSAS